MIWAVQKAFHTSNDLTLPFSERKVSPLEMAASSLDQTLPAAFPGVSIGGVVVGLIVVGLISPGAAAT